MKTNLQLSAAAVRAYCIRPIKGACNAPLQWTFALLLAILLPQSSILAQTDGGMFTDPRDGETYKTVIMPDGKRWMAENLRYRTGLNNPIFSNNTTANTFAASKSTYYCPGPGPLNMSVNQADPLACEYWGALYPFWVAYANSANTAANTTLGEQGICPNGWHLPTDNEWNLLFTKIGGTTDAGKLLKDTARGTFANNQAWKKQWTNAALQNTNTYGFSALAAGLRTTAGAYLGNGTQALFWTSTPNTNGTQASSKIFTNSSNSSTGSSAQLRADALSVRCVEGGCDEGFRIPFLVSKNGSKTLDQAFDTVFVVRSSVFYYTVFALPTAVGTWSYAVTELSSSLPSGVTVDIKSFSQSNMGTDILIELLFKGLSSANDGQTVKFNIVASNPNYCNINQELFITFKEYTGSTMTDPRDGKVYKTVTMPDGKEWMAENINYQTGMTFRATSNSPTTTTGGNQGSLSFWCPGIHDKGTSDVRTLADCEKYGALYTWDAAMWLDGNAANGAIGGSYNSNQAVAGTNSNQVGGRGICPSGWHVPTDNEWGLMLNAVETTNGNTLSNTMNSVTDGGRQNHNNGSSSTQYWLGIDAGMRLTHSSGVNYGLTRIDQYDFSVFPAGLRDYDGTSFLYRVTGCNVWSSSGFSVSSACNRNFSFVRSFVGRGPLNRSYGVAVRCVKGECGGNTIVGNEVVGDIRQMTDSRDCNTYSIVLMPDNKWWMAENLNYQAGLKFNANSNKVGGDVTTFTSTTNGTPGIGNFWCPGAASATTASLSDCDTWGALYTWECVMRADGLGSWTEGSLYTNSASGNPSSFSAPRGICPNGWHIPSDAEWGNMLNAVEAQFGGTQDHNTVTVGNWAGTNAGTTLKAANFTTGVKQATGFSVLAAGYRHYDGSYFGSRGIGAYFLSASGYNSGSAWRRLFNSNDAKVNRDSNRRAFGFSVRCQKD